MSRREAALLHDLVPPLLRGTRLEAVEARAVRTSSGSAITVAATTAAYQVKAIDQPVAAYTGAPSQPRRPRSTMR